MKRMLLVSMFQNVSKTLRTAEPDLEGKTVAFVPTASKAERLGFFAKISKWVLRSMGLAVGELDVATVSYETAKTQLEAADIIYVSGGNTFYLLQELRRTGTDELLVREIDKGKLYVGESAGAIVVAPDIGYSAAMDSVEKAPGLDDYTGLGLVDFFVVPHCGNWEMGKAAEEILAAHADGLPLRAIDDNQAILVRGDTVEILGKDGMPLESPAK